MIQTKEILVRQAVTNQLVERAYTALLSAFEESENKRIASSNGAQPDLSTAIEAPLEGSMRRADSAAAKLTLQPTLYKRFHEKNPPLPTENSGKVRLAGAIMMKDEAPYIEKTIESAAPFVDCFVILDTGSTDDSIKVARAAAHNWNTPVFVMETSWIKFGDTRNHLLDYVEKIAHFALLLDVSDEVRHGETLAPLIARWTDEYEDYSVRLAFNDFIHEYSRLVKTSWQIRYKYDVHEAIMSGGGKRLPTLPEDKFYLFQDRNAAKPSTERFKRDAIDLLGYHLLRDSTDCRVVYYLAQSLKDGKDLRAAYHFYRLRTTMMSGWHEERYMSHYWCASFAEEIGFDSSVVKDHLESAFEITAAPMAAFRLYEHYLKQHKHRLAYAWITTCCTVRDPRLRLQSDTYHMGHKRWCCLGSLAGFIGYYKEAIAAYKRAQDEFLMGEYDVARRTIQDANAKPPAADCNAAWFTFAYDKYGDAKEHPEWFADVPTAYMTIELAEKLHRH